MAINRQERALKKLQARQAFAANREQRRQNVEAPAGGVILTDERQAKSLGGPPENKAAKAGALDGIDFASAAARGAVEDAGLTAAQFKRQKPSSDRGFTADDVRGLAGG